MLSANKAPTHPQLFGRTMITIHIANFESPEPILRRRLYRTIVAED